MVSIFRRRWIRSEPTGEKQTVQSTSIPFAHIGPAEIDGKQRDQAAPPGQLSTPPPSVGNKTDLSAYDRQPNDVVVPDTPDFPQPVPRAEVPTSAVQPRTLRPPSSEYGPPNTNAFTSGAFWQLLAEESSHNGSPDEPKAVRVPQFEEIKFSQNSAVGENPALAFTPTRPKLSAQEFAGRHEVILKIIRAIEQNHAHVVIYGSRGIGKTSLVNVIAEGAALAHYKVCRYPCSTQVTFEDMFRALLRDLPRGRLAQNRNREAENFEQLLPAQGFGPIELASLLRQLEQRHALFIIDEFDRVVSDQLKNQLAETIKSLSDIAANVTFVIVGIAETLEDLIGKHTSIQRQLVGVHLPYMDRREIEALIRTGEEGSGIRFDSALRDMIVACAKGLPYGAQLLSFHASRIALARGSKIAEPQDLFAALKQILEEISPYTATTYERVTQGETKRFITELLIAAALCQGDCFGQFTADQVVRYYGALFGHDVGTLQVHKCLGRLSALRHDDQAVLIRKILTPAGSTTYAFVNPLIPQYILLRQIRRCAPMGEPG